MNAYAIQPTVVPLAAVIGPFVVGDVLYADSAGSLARLADVATGSLLVSGGVGTAPAWASNVSIGGTFTSAGLIKAESGSAVGIVAHNTAGVAMALQSGAAGGRLMWEDSGPLELMARTQAQVIVASGAVGSTLVRVNATGEVAIGNNQTAASGTRLAVMDGNVGINELSADYKLDVNGAIGFTPGNSVTPVDNGDVVFELTNNTTLTVKAKGSDGTVRTATVTLS